jgi:hypothetical protein
MMAVLIRIENKTPGGDLFESENLQQCGVDIHNGFAPVVLKDSPPITIEKIILGSHYEFADGVVIQVWDERERTKKEIRELLLSNPKLIELVKSKVITAVQKRLDDFAQGRNYDGMLSLCTYAVSMNAKFKAEGQYGVQVRDATWEKLYEIFARAVSETNPQFTGYADIETELPVLAWPE